MKFARNKCVIFTIITIVLFSGILSKSLKNHNKKHKQVHLVHDMNGFNSDINHVVRRDPTVTTVTRLGNYRLQNPYQHISMSNSNTSTAPNVGFLGRNAEIVEPHIVLHSKSPVSVIKETPAHIGYRNEDQTLTALNLETGKLEQHTRHNKVPIYGNIEEVKTVYKNDVRSYDPATKRFGPIISNYTPQ